MDQEYWLGRERDAIANAEAASFADVKLIHYGLAQRYRLEAAKVAEATKTSPLLTMKLSEQLTTAFQIPGL